MGAFSRANDEPAETKRGNEMSENRCVHEASRKGQRRRCLFLFSFLSTTPRENTRNTTWGMYMWMHNIQTE